MPVAHPFAKWVPLALATTLALVAGLHLGRHLACREGRCEAGPGDSRQRLDGLGPAPITISGSASRPMWPGMRVPLDLMLTNTQDFAMTVDHLTVTIELVRAPRATARRECSVRDFAVVQASSTLTVTLDAGETTSLGSQELLPAGWPSIAMVGSAGNQDGCKGASLQLRYAATGTQVDG